MIPHPTFYNNQLHRPLLLLIISFVPIFLSSQSAYAQETNNSSATSFGYFVLFIFFMIALYLVVRRARRPKERRMFATEVKREIRKKQGYKCAICRWNSGVLDYDHKDGNRNNNKLSNCQALCPNCHAKKTRGLIKTKTNSRSWVKVAIFLMILIIFIGILNSSK